MLKYTLGSHFCSCKHLRNNLMGFLTVQIDRKERIFPVGRLDKDSTGLLLLTNDGRFVNALLRSAHAHFKNYIVTVDQPLSNEFIARMRSGVTITTESQRDGRKKTLTAPTMPCRVSQVPSHTSSHNTCRTVCAFH